jgi:hypothetical protein
MSISEAGRILFGICRHMVPESGWRMRLEAHLDQPQAEEELASSYIFDEGSFPVRNADCRVNVPDVPISKSRLE